MTNEQPPRERSGRAIDTSGVEGVIDALTVTHTLIARLDPLLHQIATNENYHLRDVAEVIDSLMQLQGKAMGAITGQLQLHRNHEAALRERNPRE